MANGEEPAERVPVIVTPAQVEVPLRAVAAEVHHVAVAVDQGDGALCDASSGPRPLFCQLGKIEIESSS